MSELGLNQVMLNQFQIFHHPHLQFSGRIASNIPVFYAHYAQVTEKTSDSLLSYCAIHSRLKFLNEGKQILLCFVFAS